MGIWEDLDAQIAVASQEKRVRAFNMLAASLGVAGFDQSAVAVGDDEVGPQGEPEVMEQAPAPAPVRRGPKIVRPQAVAEPEPEDTGVEEGAELEGDVSPEGEPEEAEPEAEPEPEPEPVPVRVKPKAPAAPKYKVGDHVYGPKVTNIKGDVAGFEAVVKKLYAQTDGRKVATIQYTDPDYRKLMPKGSPLAQNVFLEKLNGIVEQGGDDQE